MIVLTFSLSDWILYSVFFSFFEIYAYIFSISDPMISLKISCLILCVHYVLLLSIWLVVHLIGHTICFIQGWCHFILVIHFWSYHLFSYRDGAIFIFICSLFLRPYHLFFRDGAVFILFIWVWVIGSFCREVHFGHCEASRDFINL